MDVSAVTASAVASSPDGGARYSVQTAPKAVPSPQTSEVLKMAAEGGGSTQAPSSEQVAQAVKQVNDAFAQNGQNLYAAIEKDKATGIDVVKVLDKNTEEVISQFPSKAIIGLAEAISESLAKKGQMINISA